MIYFMAKGNFPTVCIQDLRCLIILFCTIKLQNMYVCTSTVYYLFVQMLSFHVFIRVAYAEDS